MGLHRLLQVQLYPTNLKVTGSIPNEVIGLFNLPTSSSLTIDSASNRNEYQKYSENLAR
jgi:hypothetical protein